MNERFSHNGFEFEYHLARDEFMGAPWEEHHVHGPVSEWEIRSKRPGELVLAWDRNAKRFYDYQAAVQLALKDGWGTRRMTMPETATKKQIAAQAAMEDFEHLKAWCDNEWEWSILIVEDLESGNTDSLGGIESNMSEEELLSYAKDAAERLRPMTEFEREVRRAAGE